MRTAIVIMFAAVLAASPAQSGEFPHLPLRPGQTITLHVGQIADLKLPSGHPYTVDLEGDSVTSMETGAAEHRVRSYRGAHPGNASLLIVPADLKPNSCVDCVTRHCFLTVIP
jgi:hypothetical protein